MADQGTMTVLGAQATCCVLTIAAILYARLRELDRRALALECLRADSAAYLASAEVVLKDPDTPSIVRRMVLLALNIVRSPDLARDFACYIAGDDEKERSISDDLDHPLDQAIRRLQISRPDLAERAQEAAFGLLFCAPFLYADKIRVEAVREGATRPAHIWARLGEGMARLWPSQPAEDDNPLPVFAARA